MMLLCVIVKTVGLADLKKMRRTDCFGETRLVLHVPSWKANLVLLLSLICVLLCRTQQVAWSGSYRQSQRMS